MYINKSERKWKLTNNIVLTKKNTNWLPIIPFIVFEVKYIYISVDTPSVLWSVILI